MKLIVENDNFKIKDNDVYTLYTDINNLSDNYQKASKELISKEVEINDQKIKVIGTSKIFQGYYESERTKIAIMVEDIPISQW